LLLKPEARKLVAIRDTSNLANSQFQPSKSVEIRLFCIILDQKPIKIEHEEMTNLNRIIFDGVFVEI